MLLTLFFVVFVYLFAVESFTAFLYPNPDEVASYFQAAALPNWMFDGIVIMATVMTVLSWCYLYMQAHGRTSGCRTGSEGLANPLVCPVHERLCTPTNSIKRSDGRSCASSIASTSANAGGRDDRRDDLIPGSWPAFPCWARR